MKPAHSDLFARLALGTAPLVRLLHSLLTIGAGIYGLIVTGHTLLFANGYRRCRRLPAPVISIGNITAGGTGKTPAVVWLVRQLRAMNFPRPVILSRGYGGDEIRLLHEQLPHTPHVTNSDRFTAGSQAIAHHGPALCFVLDDGFQHRRLHRDLDVVLIDATRPFGFGHLLPRGFLREPVSHLRRAQVIMITKADMVADEALQRLHERLHLLCPRALRLEAVHRPLSVHRLGELAVHDPTVLAGVKCLLFTGIGNPESFTATVRQLGIAIAQTCYFPDHHPYCAADWSLLAHEAEKTQATAMITTAKDAVKLLATPLPAVPVWVVDIELQVRSGQAALLRLLTNIVGSVTQ